VTKERGEESKMKNKKRKKLVKNSDMIKKLIAQMDFATKVKIAQEDAKNKSNNK